jgi:hypothetical protein
VLGVDVRIEAAAGILPGDDGAARAVRDDYGDALAVVGGADRQVDEGAVGPGGPCPACRQGRRDAEGEAGREGKEKGAVHDTPPTLRATGGVAWEVSPSTRITTIGAATSRLVTGQVWHPGWAGTTGIP